MASNEITIYDYRVRNLRRVESKDHGGKCSFEFEVLCGDRWRSFGPQVFGNWTIRSDISGTVFPASHIDIECFGHRYETVDLGHRCLDDAMKAIEAAEEDEREPNPPAISALEAGR